MNNSDLFGKFLILNVSIFGFIILKWGIRSNFGATLRQTAPPGQIGSHSQPVRRIFLLLFAAQTQRANMERSRY